MGWAPASELSFPPTKAQASRQGYCSEEEWASFNLRDCNNPGQMFLHLLVHFFTFGVFCVWRPQISILDFGRNRRLIIQTPLARACQR